MDFIDRSLQAENSLWAADVFWLCPDAVQMLSLMQLNNSTGMQGISDPWSHGVLGEINYVFKEKETWLCDVTTSKTTGPCHTTMEATPRLLETALEGVADKPCECQL